ncbi:hypothetical protein HMPREF6485_1611 [Segatella buccae ATCC 33574]|uniref:Uncharacterized protein n=1 Tax=Segatella buccae ATCC 33574 TaxID=873513 RepID=E6K831_9BACT|nr:hypothetical protein HMPREF6485_1611 [Segatella buccae ATCC 33574]
MAREPLVQELCTGRAEPLHRAGGALNAFLIEAGIAVNISLTVVSLLRRGKLAVFL